MEEPEMAAEAAQPSIHTLTLTQEERDRLLDLMKQCLGEARVEAHRTHTPAFRELVLHEESLIRGLVGKLEGLRS
jgi:hypothetical protein